MNLQHLIDNKSTLKSLNKKLKKFQNEYRNNTSILEGFLNISLLLLVAIISVFGFLICMSFLEKGNILGFFTSSSFLLFDFLIISFISFARDKLAIGKKYNKFQQAFNEFEGNGISFSKKQLIESTINNLNVKEKIILEDFIEKDKKKYKIKFQHNITNILLENEDMFHKYDRDDLIEVINLIEHTNLKLQLINKAANINPNKNKINKNKVILEI